MGEFMTKLENLVEEIVTRLLLCKEENELVVYDALNIRKIEFITDVHITYQNIIKDVDNCNTYLLYVDFESIESISQFIEKKRRNSDIVLIIDHINNKDILSQSLQLENIYYIDEGAIAILGPIFEYPKNLLVPKDFKVLTMIQMYNEKDIVEKLIEYLLSQKLDILIIDNWSDDGTFELLEKMQYKNPDRIILKRFPEEGKSDQFDLYKILEYKERLSKELSYDWFIHYDSDEYRISPWKDVTLRDAIYYIDKLGYNMIENTVIDFKLVDENSNNIFMTDGYFDFGHRPTHFIQYKTWKKSKYVDIKSSGGHDIRIKNPKSFPLKILNRHYPYRSMEQAMKKVFKDRKPRMEQGKKEHGWHGHYDNIQQIQSIICDKRQLIKWNEKTFDDLYISLFLGCGIDRESDNYLEMKNIPLLSKKRIIIYGAGAAGRTIFNSYKDNNDIIAWVDAKYDELHPISNIRIKNPEEIPMYEFDYIVIAILNTEIQNEVVKNILKKGIEENRILKIQGD